METECAGIKGEDNGTEKRGGKEMKSSNRGEVREQEEDTVNGQREG